MAGETQSLLHFPVDGVTGGYINLDLEQSPTPQAGAGGGGAARPTVGQTWPRGNGNA